MSDNDIDITGMLSGAQAGSVDDALPYIYEELERVAAAYLTREREDHTIQAGDLVHEIYLRLRGKQRAHWKSRKHFFVVAANAMRQYLIDYARKHGADKRTPPTNQTITLPQLDDHAIDFIDLDQALNKLETLDDELAMIVKLRFYAGLPAAEIGTLMALSSMAVSRRWWQAKQWLKRELAS